MKQQFSDNDILKLLSTLKDAENNYPSAMIQSRRDMYVKQAAAIAVLSKTAGNGTNAGGNGKSPGSGTPGAGSSSMGKFLEAALMITIAMEAGVAAYIYRDKIIEFINTTIFPKVEVVSSPPEDLSSTPAAIPVTGDESITGTPTEPITATVTVTGTDTPLPAFVAPDDKGGNGVIQAVESTPTPNANPGNHYGNTPKPERTKDANNNSSNNNNKDKDK